MPKFITLIAGTYQPQKCGVAHYTSRLRDALKQQDIESIVLTTHEAAIEAKDSSVRGVVKDWQFANLISLLRSVHSTNTDILHIQHAAGTYRFERTIFLLPLLLKMTGYNKPIITTVHEYGWWEWQPKYLPSQFVEWLKMWGQNRGCWDREDGFLLTLSDAIITTNIEAKTLIHERLTHLNKHIFNIPIAANIECTPIDITSARQQLRKICHWGEDTVVLAFFGFLHPVKGLEILFPAFQKVLITHPQARLLLVGGIESLALRGEEAKRYWDKLHSLARELNISDKLHFTGYLDADIASQYLSGADIGVLPFNHGVTMKSGSLLTLFAHNLPVIGTQHSIPLPQEMRVQLVQPRNIDALADALSHLLNHPEICKDLGETGRAFVEKLSWSSIARSHLEIYLTQQENSH
jgi:glycosyltransferase involved in cell wall biosynthesis